MKYLHKPKLEETEQFYASYGSFAHEIIEEYYKGKLEKHDMVNKYLFEFSDKVKGKRPNERTLNKYITGGFEYFQNFEPFKYEPVAVEKRVEFDLDGMHFIGYIDYLGLDGDGLVIIDHKSGEIKPRSGRKKPTVKDQKLNAILRQLYLYSAAIKQMYGSFPTKLCLNCFRTGVFIEEEFDKKAYDEAIEWIIMTIEEIKKEEDFPPDVSWFKCHNICELKNECIYLEDS